MVNYEENERALKELFQDVKSVPDTLPPVYICGEIIISYDRRGKIRVIASTKSEQPSEDGWFKRWQARLVPLTGAGAGLVRCMHNILLLSKIKKPTSFPLAWLEGSEPRQYDGYSP